MLHLPIPGRLRHLRALDEQPTVREAMAMLVLAGLAIAGSAIIGIWFAAQVLRLGH